MDKKLFKPRKKDLDYLIFGSAPNRGLKRLSLFFDAVKTRVGRPVRMNAYSNMAKMHPNEAAMEHDYAAEYEAVRKSGVSLFDPLPQDKFAEELGMAGLMILPTDYPEICSNSVLQSLACGTPIITTGNIGSAGEWVKHGKNGMLTEFQVHDYMIHTLEMVRNTVKVLTDEWFHRKMISNATKTSGLFTWEEIGGKWDKMFRRLI